MKADNISKTAYTFQFGTVFIEYEDDVLTRLVCRPEDYEISEADIQGRSSFSDRIMTQLEEYLRGERKNLEVKYKLQGTEFQMKVWQALMDIPYGETRSYGQIAAAIGNPKASRAVGMANNKNTLLLIVPCHRVVGADGSLTGYAGGLEMKRHLLKIESK